MELRKLEYFLAVAEQGSYRKAADKIHVSQPSLSQQVNSLEEELGFPLFVRSKKGVVLTNAGFSFQRSVERILSELNDAIGDARQIANHIEPPHSLEISDLIVDSVVLNDLVLRAIIDIKARFPDITLSNSRPPYHKSFDFLLDGRTHVLLRDLYYGENVPDEIKHITLNQNNFCFLVPFSWSDGKHVEIPDLREKINHSTLYLENDITRLPIYKSILKRLSLEPKLELIDFRDYHRDYIHGLVERGEGIAISTEEYVRSAHNPFLYLLSIPLTEASIRQSIFWVNESSLVQHFIRSILPPDRVTVLKGNAWEI
jgi:DNA-binding transcriptional LysR family regulator